MDNANASANLGEFAEVSLTVKEDSSPDRSEEQATAEFYAAIKARDVEKVKSLLLNDPTLVHVLDKDGYSCVHWAAKRGDIATLEELRDKGADLCNPTSNLSKMMPIHWAASDGKFESIRFLIQCHPESINCQDSESCTPLIIAAQHRQVTCVAFLMKTGANVGIRDTHGDSAMHWAAYKGFTDVVGLLSHLAPESVGFVDEFDQTPLHLASLRAENDTVEYLIKDCHSDVSLKDKYSRTPVEVAMHKGNFETEWIIRRCCHPSNYSLVRSVGIKKLMRLKVLCMLFFGMNVKELSVWPWRIVFWSNFIGTYITLFVFAPANELADCSSLHLVSTMAQFVWWICFICCLLVPAGIVTNPLPTKLPMRTLSANFTPFSNKEAEDEASKPPPPSYPKDSYDASLSEIAHADTADDCPALCHSCRVKRPLRSKHCSVTRKCIHKFDHFCPFVGNAIGLYNYRFFNGLLNTHLIVFSLWCWTAWTYHTRIGAFTWMFSLYIVYSIFWMLMMFGLLGFHWQLISLNMTTNEHVNEHKYAYLRNEYGIAENPFLRMSLLGNIKDVIFPLTQSFYTREEVLAALPRPVMTGWTVHTDLEDATGHSGNMPSFSSLNIERNHAMNHDETDATPLLD